MQMNTEKSYEALHRAKASAAMSNIPLVYAGFLEMGIPEAEIIPRENVLSFHAWRAMGRTVRKGEHGVKLVTWIDAKQAETGESSKLARTVSVFHVSQTDAL